MVRRIPAVSYEVECCCFPVVRVSSRCLLTPKLRLRVQIKQKVGASFVIPGQTTKEEVLAKLQPVNSGINGVRLFLARCSSSNKGGFALLCGYISCLGGGSRLWKTSNALLEFDEHDLLQRYSVFGDNILVTKLSPLRAKTQLIYGRDFFQRPG